MQIAAITSHAALTASPRLSATMANDTAPRSATTTHNSFVCGAAELLMIFMDVLPHCRKPNQTRFTVAGRSSRQECIGRDLPLRTHRGQDCLAQNQSRFA